MQFSHEFKMEISLQSNSRWQNNRNECDSNSFIFSLENIHGQPLLIHCTNQSVAIYGLKYCGPIFINFLRKFFFFKVYQFSPSGHASYFLRKRNDVEFIEILDLNWILDLNFFPVTLFMFQLLLNICFPILNYTYVDTFFVCVGV